MGTHRFTIKIGAPVETVFDLYTSLDRMAEWTGGVTGVSDLSGPIHQAGTTYVVHFGRMASKTTVLEAERPHRFATHFGNTVLRGINTAKFEPIDGGTLLTQQLTTEGVIPAVAGWLFARGSWKGSFRGELKQFAEIAEREASGATGR